MNDAADAQPEKPQGDEPTPTGSAADDAGAVAEGYDDRTGARAGLAQCVEAAVTHHQATARHDAERLSHVFRVLEFAAAHAASFVDARFGGAPARDLARRAAIAELAVALRMTERRVSRLASDAAVLCRRLPAVLQAMHDGELDYEQAKVIIDTVDPLTDRPEVVAALDERLAVLARTVNPAKLRREARRLVERVQAVSTAARHAKARAERRVELQPAPDGMAWLHLLLPAADAFLIKNRLGQAAARLRAVNVPDGPDSSNQTDSDRSADTPGAAPSRPDLTTRAPRGLADEKRLDQIRADLARDLLLHGLPPEAAPARASVVGVRPTVHVTVPVMTLLGRADEPATLDGYGPIDPRTARELAGQAPSFSRLLTHPVSSAVLDVDRTTYRVPADLRRWLQVRDETCRFPGCTRSAIGCDLDHSEAWAARRGKTAHDNLAHLCAAHHHLKHDTAWSLRHVNDGIIEWTSLTGARYRTAPAGALHAAGTPPPGPAPGPESDPDAASEQPPPF